jgi:small subunit ribosomal protein S8
MTDIIADMLTRIRTALVNKTEKISMPNSKMKAAIAEILFKEGYIEGFKVESEEGSVKKNLVLTLKYVSGQSVIMGLKRISTPGLRVYSESIELPKVLNGMGIAVISTNKGVMTDKHARKLNVGGEVLAYIW